MPSFEISGPAQQYWLDTWQRSILFLDVLRQRGNNSRAHEAEAVPHVLDFEVELVLDGRTLPRPVNYGLVRIIPPAGTRLDPAKRPFVVVDPRAGHGPGIGGMKKESEIGVVLDAGHPCYFVGFLPEPVEGQTIEDVCTAEAAFIAAVAARHPRAEGKPAVIANCQAGWQTMIMAATNPDLPGPILLAGSPLSYWAGVRGKNPMRYLGGVLGGTWLTALAGDIGHGKFDGANLVANFEAMNPANTWWEKPYNVFANVDTEAERFLDFETWWGSPVLLNAGEMQWIADNLFVGNRLATGALRTSEGLRIDLRNIKSPIIVFCSWGDDVTPPQQALGWITDIYADDDDLITNGATIVYSLHQSIGHLGIFVSGKVAGKEHEEFTDCMDMIDLMPPGLYEAVITEVDAGTANADLIDGKWLFSLEARALDDIRKLGANNDEDELRFATAARVSEVNLGLYRAFAQPAVQAMFSAAGADAVRKSHPNRMRFAMFSDQNPMMQLIARAADSVRRERRPVAPDNPWLAAEKAMSSFISTSFEAAGRARDGMTENLFLQTYGSPLLQALTGLGPDVAVRRRQVERDLVREADEKQQLAELERRFEAGGAVEAMLRALIYVRAADGAVDERGYATLQALRAAQPKRERLKAAELKAAMREQFLLHRLDQERTVSAIPRLLTGEIGRRRQLLEAIRKVLGAQGALSEEAQRRFDRVEQLFDVGGPRSISKESANA
ncbi:MAG: DUF3141 domain-containing protein [Allosphingosinicella sp.]